MTTSSVSERGPITFDDFLKVDMRLGVIVQVEDFPKAKNPSYKVTVDFGPKIGTKTTSAQVTGYTKEELKGMKVVAVVNFPPKNIAGFMSEILVLGVKGDDGKVSLLSPTRPAQIGEAVY